MADDRIRKSPLSVQRAFCSVSSVESTTTVVVAASHAVVVGVRQLSQIARRQCFLCHNRQFFVIRCEKLSFPCLRVAPLTAERHVPVLQVAPLTAERHVSVLPVAPLTAERLVPVLPVAPLTAERLVPVLPVAPLAAERHVPVLQVAPLTAERLVPVLQVAPLTTERERRGKEGGCRAPWLSGPPSYVNCIKESKTCPHDSF